MIVDAHTAQLTAAVTLGAVTVYLIVSVALHPDHRAGRVIAVAFLTITGTAVLAYALPGDGTAPPLLGSTAAAGYVLAIGLLRAGLRLQQIGGPPRLLLPFLAAGVTAVSGLVDVALDELRVPLLLALAFSVVYTGICAVESYLGPVASAPSARMLQGVMGAATVAVVLTSVLTVSRLIVWTAAIDVVVAIGSLVLFVLAALCVTSLRAETARLAWWTDGLKAEGVGFELNEPAAFRREAHDRIDRSLLAGQAVGVVWVEILRLEDLQTAYGTDALDRAIIYAGTVIRRQAPAFSTLGHLGGGRFVVVTAARAARPIDRVANAILNGLALRSPDLPVALTHRIGTSVGQPPDIDLERLIADARSDAGRELSPS